MSCACGLKENGIFILFPINESAICGVKEDVAHVSNTLSSPLASFLHLGHFLDFCNGSTGSSFSSATITSSQLSQCQTGIGTPKCLFLDMLQSQSRPLTQFSYLLNMNSGCHFTFFP